MKYTSIAIAILVAGISACSNSADKKNERKQDSLVKKDNGALVSQEKAADQFVPGRVFSADRADLHESLEIEQLDKNTINYRVKMENGECAAWSFKGKAILKQGDAESDEDEKGNGFMVNEYVDDKNGSCGIYIRIGVDNGFTDRARFIVADCPSACKKKSESEPLRSTK